jgi:hypothetical protein
MAAGHYNAVTSALQPPSHRSRAPRRRDGLPFGHMGFSHDELDLIDRTEEVEIETSAAGDDAHRAIVWAVVDGDSVFVRSYRGANARWYREASANPSVALHVDGQRMPVTAVPVHDSDSIERTSAGLLRKYPDDPAVAAMVRPEVLDLTFRLDRT